jgi:PKD repeat protein
VSIDGGTSAGSWNYYWKDSSGNILNVTSQATAADTLFGLNAGAYRVEVSADGTCFSGSADFMLQATQASNAYFTSNDTVDMVDVVTFSNNSARAGSYWWEFGDGMGTAGTIPYHYYTATGTYTVTLYAYGSACPDTSVFTRQLVVVQQTMSAAENNAAQINTAIEKDGNGYFVQFGLDKDYSAVIAVTDMLGRAVDYKEVKIQAGVKSYLSVPANAQGTIVSVKSSTGVMLAKKLIVE